jgi:hypothetical protein
MAAAARRLGTTALALGGATLLSLGLLFHDPGVVGGAAVLGMSAWWCRPRPDPGRWHRGAEGEQATARLLANLPRRFVVLHDRRLPGRRGNLDHVVIGPSGVWVVDSKARQAPLRVRRGQVWAGDHPIDVDPVTAQAAILEHSLGVPVGAIVAVHGSGLRRRGKNVGGVRVVPAARLTRRLRRGRQLGRADVVALVALVDRLFPRCE